MVAKSQRLLSNVSMQHAAQESPTEEHGSQNPNPGLSDSVTHTHHPYATTVLPGKQYTHMCLPAMTGRLAFH